MTRRSFLAASIAASLAGSKASSPLSVEGYIFQQFAERSGKSLEEVVPQVLRMAQSAGFTKIELSPPFFAPGVNIKTSSLLTSLNLKMPSIYVGGAMHNKEDANKTIQNALQYARLAAPFGCQGLVTNPDPKPGNQPKTDDELKLEADCLNQMGRSLEAEGIDLRCHHHTPQLENHAREWHFILANTDPKLVKICVDVDWAYEGGFDPVAFLKEVGGRLQEIHVRSARNKIWLEDVEDSDIDYYKIADYLKHENLHPLVVVELAYRAQTVVTRSLDEDLKLSRIYTERVLNLMPGNNVRL